MASIWSETVHVKSYPTLQGDQKTDILIIGGGMAGVLCAYFLQQKGANFLLVEANRIGSGMTQNTTAKITAQHGLLYQQLVAQGSPHRAKQYLCANQQALTQYRAMSQSIDCAFEEKPAYVYSLTDRKKIETEANVLQSLGLHTEVVDTLPLPFSIAAAIRMDKQAQFHPLQFLSGISQGLPIYEHTLVTKIKRNKAYTKSGIITAKKIIIATHFPFVDAYGLYFAKQYQHRSYVLALQNAAPIDGMYVDEQQNGMSFRSYKELLFVGGGDHRTGKQGGGYQELRQFVGRKYPLAEERFAWAAQDCMSLDGIPYIGQYSAHTPQWFVTTGFNKWGMTSSMVSANILSDMVLGIQNPYQDVFSPSRSMYKPQLLCNIGEAAIHLLTPSVKRCPHLGCALQWNKAEKTWDCPCHGSRFDRKGRLLNSPAAKDAKL